MTEYCLCVFTSLFITVRPINFMDGKNAMGSSAMGFFCLAII
jgi:hypothetical protein